MNLSKIGGIKVMGILATTFLLMLGFQNCSETQFSTLKEAAENRAAGLKESVELCVSEAECADPDQDQGLDAPESMDDEGEQLADNDDSETDSEGPSDDSSEGEDDATGDMADEGEDDATDDMADEGEDDTTDDMADEGEDDATDDMADEGEDDATDDMAGEGEDDTADDMADEGEESSESSDEVADDGEEPNAEDEVAKHPAKKNQDKKNRNRSAVDHVEREQDQVRAGSCGGVSVEDLVDAVLIVDRVILTSADGSQEVFEYGAELSLNGFEIEIPEALRGQEVGVKFDLAESGHYFITATGDQIVMDKLPSHRQHNSMKRLRLLPVEISPDVYQISVNWQSRVFPSPRFCGLLPLTDRS